MRLFLLLPLLFSFSIARRSGTHLRVHSAYAFKLQCESMNYRSYVDGDICYFAIRNKMVQDRGDLMCRNTYRGAKMYLERARDKVLGKLFLNPSDYHDASSSGELGVLCAFDAQYSCEDGDLALPGRCVMRSDKPITWSEASTFCRGKGATSVVVHNDLENSALAGILSKNEAGWLLPSRGDAWSAADETIDHWEWFFENSTPADLKCSDDSQHAVIANNAKDECAANGQWKVDHATNTNIALCVKDATCPLCPPPKELAEETSTTTTSTTTTTTTTTTPRPIVHGAPKERDLLALSYYYNWGRVLHGYAADDAGYQRMQSNGIGYDGSSGAGVLGGSLSQAGYDRLDEVCNDPEHKKHIVKIWMVMSGNAMIHTTTDPGGNGHFVGYVALQSACGATIPMRMYNCLVSADVMYGSDLSWNTWYRWGAWGSGYVFFWLWPTSKTSISQNEKE